MIATGARYRKLAVPRLEEFEGTSVYYAATLIEAQLCRGDPVAVVGGGNSAGQAALFLAEPRRAGPTCIVRDDDLGRDMSRYLADRIERSPNIEVLLHTEVRELDRRRARSRRSSSRTTGPASAARLEARALFVFIGAEPHTRWLADQVALDDDGFVLTGADAAESGRHRVPWTPAVRAETSSGVFAAGDVRSGSVKRVASAVGEGSMAVRLVHEHLAGRAPVVAPGRAPGLATAEADPSERPSASLHLDAPALSVLLLRHPQAQYAAVHAGVDLVAGHLLRQHHLVPEAADGPGLPA